MCDLDWTALQSDLVTCIGDLLIADDLADFIRFRAVCQPWRSFTEETKRRAVLQHPGNWIMLSDPEISPTEPIEFYNTFTHKSFSFDLTDYLDSYSFFGSFDCLILLKNNITQGFALLNPFMKSVTPLPSKVEWSCLTAPPKIDNIIDDITFLSDVYVTSSATIVLRFSFLGYLVWAKPGDQSWMYAEFNVGYPSSNVLFCEDRIFAVDIYLGFVQINFANEVPSKPEVEVVIPNDELLDHSICTS